VLENGGRTADLIRGTNPQGYNLLSTTAMGAQVRDTLRQILAKRDTLV
jgi:3-isopropylmalate dehydrogenase